MYQLSADPGGVDPAARLDAGVVGSDANLGDGTVVANLRHDGEPVALTHAGERASTGRRGFAPTTAPGETVLCDVAGGGERYAAPDGTGDGDEHAATDLTD